MLPWIVVPLVLAVLYVWGQKRRKKHQRKQHFLGKEGHAPETARVVSSLKETQPYVDTTRCFCGGKIVKRSQAALVDQPAIIVIGCECLHCDEKIRLYFRVEYMH